MPTFQYSGTQGTYTLVGRDPAQGGVTTIPVVLVPVALSFEAGTKYGQPYVLDAGADVRSILRSPVISQVPFGASGKTQYADALLRANFPKATHWHTLLAKRQVRPVKITIPAGYGYVLSSKRTGTHLGMADAEFVQREIFKQVPKLDGELVIAVTHNTAYYTFGDATVCCSWGTHGVDTATGNSFILASYLHAAPAIVADQDVQPLTEQLGEFAMDPLHDPLFHPVFRKGMRTSTGNVFPPWLRPAGGGCGGSGIGAAYTLLDPTDTNPRSNLPEAKSWPVASSGSTWHLANVALLRWYLSSGDGLGSAFSFPEARALATPAEPCPIFSRAATADRPPAPPAVVPIPLSAPNNGHKLIGYWTSHGPLNSVFRLRDVSPQWDIAIVAFAVPDHTAPEGTLALRIRAPRQPEIDLAQLKDDIRYLKSHGKKVMVSLGGGGQVFTLNDRSSIPNFVSSVSHIVSEFGFDGIDLDFETPSLVLDPGDTDFRHPTTPSIVNLIAGLRQLSERFGPHFMISLVPEGTQLPAGYASYGGQFGSYLPILWGIRDILSFVDAQDYNTPPLEGLDGEIYQLGSADYHAAMTELLLHGFAVGRNPSQFFPALGPKKVATGFLVGATTPKVVQQSMDMIIAGQTPPGSRYKLRNPGGYRGFLGAMFWTIDADRNEGLSFSNSVGPQLHAYPPAK
ncbi:MAG: glycosyl hydrolase family 18 protein [Acidobacteriota bacterium]